LYVDIDFIGSGYDQLKDTLPVRTCDC